MPLRPPTAFPRSLSLLPISKRLLAPPPSFLRVWRPRRRRRQHRVARALARVCARMSDKCPSTQIARLARPRPSDTAITRRRRRCRGVVGYCRRREQGSLHCNNGRRREAFLSRRQPERQRTTPHTSTLLHSTTFHGKRGGRGSYRRISRTEIAHAGTIRCSGERIRTVASALTPLPH